MARAKDRDNENLIGRRFRGRNAPEWRQVYFVEAVGLGLVKIGCADSAAKRMADLQVGCPVPLRLIGVSHADDAHEHEHRLHKAFAHLRERGEWFRLAPDLQEFIDDVVLNPAGQMMRWTYDPGKHSPAAVTVHRLPGEPDQAFSDRLCVVLNALVPGTVEMEPAAT